MEEVLKEILAELRAIRRLLTAPVYASVVMPQGDEELAGLIEWRESVAAGRYEAGKHTDPATIPWEQFARGV